jgi:uncharacterized membrane protein
MLNLIIALWCIGFILPVFIPQLAPFLNLTYKNVCHQNVSKTIYSGKYHLLVCSRCTGIYLGLLFSSILIWLKPYKNFQLKYFIIASFPMIIDILFYSLGIYTYSKPMALFTGFVFGSAGFFYIWEGIEKLLNELYSKKERTS